MRTRGTPWSSPPIATNFMRAPPTLPTGGRTKCSRAGGAWFGVTRGGRWALITNFREGVARDPDAPSRGGLVTQALNAADTAIAFAARASVDGQRFHGFNLLMGDGTAGCYASNRASGGKVLARGIVGL